MEGLSDPWFKNGLSRECRRAVCEWWSLAHLFMDGGALY